MTELWSVLLILAGASLIRGATGFGDALFAMPLLAFVMPVRHAAPLMAMTALWIAFLILRTEWRAVEFRSAWQLILFGLMGIPFGVWGVRYLDEQLVKRALGAFVVCFSAWSLYRPEGLHLKSSRSAPAFGFCAGLLGGAYNTSGPPLVLYGTMRRWPVDSFRAALQAYGIFSSIGILTAHGIAGNITTDVFRLFVFGVIPVTLAVVIGKRLTQAVSPKRFGQIVYGLLIVIGLGLVFASGDATGG